MINGEERLSTKSGRQGTSLYQLLTSSSRLLSCSASSCEGAFAIFFSLAASSMLGTLGDSFSSAAAAAVALGDSAALAASAFAGAFGSSFRLLAMAGSSTVEPGSSITFASPRARSRGQLSGPSSAALFSALTWFMAVSEGSMWLRSMLLQVCILATKSSSV